MDFAFYANKSFVDVLHEKRDGPLKFAKSRDVLNMCVGMIGSVM